MLKSLTSFRDESNNGGEIIGTLLSFRCPEKVVVPFYQLTSAMELNPDIPKDWIPEQRNQLSLYLAAMTALNRTSPKQFVFDKDVCGFDEDEFGGYFVTRLLKEQASERPTSHKIIHMLRILEPVDTAANKIQYKTVDVISDEGIIIDLKRVSGDENTDKIGQSKFEIIVNGGNPYSALYQPFVKTLTDTFNDMLNFVYRPKQIREIVQEIVRDKLNSTPVNGWYFTPTKALDALAALEYTLNEVNDGINFMFLPLKRGGSEADNLAVQSIAAGIEDSFLDELDKLEQDIVTLGESESKTREATWADRLKKLEQVKAKIAEYKEIQLIKTESAELRLEDVFETIKAAIESNKKKGSTPLTDMV
jgi:hypothetical protein